MLKPVATAALAFSNPLDEIEQLLLQRDIAHDRPIEDEIIGEVKGSWNHYKLWFRWEEALGVLMMSCSMDVQVTKTASKARIYPLLAELNEKLWLGHFEMSSEDGTIMFRYSVLAQDATDILPDQIEAIIDVAITECNRCYPALQSVLWGNSSVNEAITLAMFDTAGEA